MKLTDTQMKLVQEISDSSIGCVRTISSALVQIREGFKEEGEWVEFARSNTLAYGERTLYDYCAASEWLKTTKVKDGVLGRLSVRSMAWMAQLKETDSKKFNELEKRLISGEVLTQADIRPPSQDTKEVVSRKELVEMVRQFKNDGDKLKKELEFWKDALHLVEKNNGVELTVYKGNVDEITDTDPLWQRITVSNKKKTVRKKELAPV